jgi:outer membrane protein assembly factor BamB
VSEEASRNTQRVRHTRNASRVLLTLLASFALLSLNGCEQRGEVKPLWIASLPFHFLESHNVREGVVVAFGADKEFYDETEELQGTLIGLDSKTGNKLWQNQINPARRYFQQGALQGGSFIVTGGSQVYYRDLNNALHAVDIHTGAERWQAKDVLAILTTAEGQVLVVNAVQCLTCKRNLASS